MGVLDIDSVIKKWVKRWNHVDDDTTFDIDWTRVHFATGSSNAYSAQQQQQQQQQQQRQWGSSNNNQRSQVVFTSNYVNNTDEVQTHTFKMTRTTDATVKTRLTKGFAKSGNVGIKIEVPQNINNLTSSFGSDIEIAHQDDNTVKHAVTWSLDSTVAAQPNTRTTAKMCITETKYDYSFDAEIHIRGKVLVRLNDGQSERFVEGNVARILSDEKEEGSFNPGDMVTIQGKKVTWKVAGTLSFKFGISQDTTVSSKPL